jgi:hypothetical protein
VLDVLQKVGQECVATCKDRKDFTAFESVGLLSWTLWLDFEKYISGLKCNGDVQSKSIQTLI